MQLDLFLDSRAVMLANDVVRAIDARDGGRAMRYVAELRAEATDYPTLPSLEILARALMQWQRPQCDVTNTLSAVAWLDDVIATAARNIFAARGSDVVAPFFRDLAEASRGLAYAPSNAKAHRAWLCLQCGDWEEAEAAALGIPGAIRIPDALQWITLARYRRGGLSAARPTLFALAWRDPPRLPELIEKLHDEVLQRD